MDVMGILSRIELTGRHYGSNYNMERNQGRVINSDNDIKHNAKTSFATPAQPHILMSSVFVYNQDIQRTFEPDRVSVWSVRIDKLSRSHQPSAPHYLA